MVLLARCKSFSRVCPCIGDPCDLCPWCALDAHPACLGERTQAPLTSQCWEQHRYHCMQTTNATGTAISKQTFMPLLCMRPHATGEGMDGETLATLLLVAHSTGAGGRHVHAFAAELLVRDRESSPCEPTGMHLTCAETDSLLQTRSFCAGFQASLDVAACLRVGSSS